MATDMQEALYVQVRLCGDKWAINSEQEGKKGGEESTTTTVLTLNPWCGLVWCGGGIACSFALGE